MRALDTETHLIRPGLQAPPLVVVSAADDGAPGWLVDRHDAIAFVRQSFAAGPVALHNSAFDLAVLVEAGLPIDEVFAWLDLGLVSDTMIREKLLDIAEGTKFYRTASGAMARRTYDLADLGRKYCGRELDKSGDSWRLRYAEIEDLPIADWPAAAREYAIADAETTRDVWRGQEERRRRLAQRLGGDPLADEERQIRRLWALYLMRAHGIRTDGAAVDRLEVLARESFDELLAELVANGGGIVRPDGTRDTKRARDRMIRVCAEVGIEVPITATGEAKIKAGTLDHAGAVAAGYVALDADACKRTGDLALNCYAKITSFRTVLSKDVEALRRGVDAPIHTRINTLLDTGRPSSSAPNIFNIRGASSDPDDPFPIRGIRECFIPRPGRWFLQADVSGLELATLAQVLIRIVGWSVMADTIKRYGEAGALHTLLAARLLGITDAEAFRREALGKKADPEFYLARQTAKVCNFGFPGGLGKDSLIFYARAKYRLNLSPERAVELKRIWLETWPEMRVYFKTIADMVEAGGGQATIRQLFSDRYRGACFYTQACNGFFQALGADATGLAVYDLARACYETGVEPALYGARLVNYVYDEVILEVPADVDRANAAAEALVARFEAAANQFLPDVPIKMGAPVLMLAWSKDAKPTRDAAGRLIPWVP